MKKFSEKIKKYLKERGWDNLLPSDIAKSISIEAAELLENFQWENLSKEELKKDKEKVEDIKKELADVLIYCFEMAFLLDIDIEKAANKKLALASKKYPKSLFNKKSMENISGVHDKYWKIKKEYRKK